MLVFEPFSIAGLQKALPYIRKSDILCSDISAGYLFMWQDDLCFCEWNNTLVIRQNVGEQPAFSWPIGSDPDGMIDELLVYVESNHLPLRFFAVDENTLKKIQKDSRLKSPMWAYDDRWSDYIYAYEEAKTFSGRKYSGQRNHINKFKKLFGEPVIRFLTQEDNNAVENMLAEYEKEHLGVNQLERLEFERTRKLLSVYKSLGLFAAGLFVDGQMAAFSIGEVVGETFIIHVEKALKRFEGAYPTIYSGFVRLMDIKVGKSLSFVNREDDSGDIGLRVSKQQYHPINLVKKYVVHIDSPAKKLLSVPDIVSDGVVLTALRESDKREYCLLNTDVQNNRYWGYDYRDDASITGQITEETFYRATMYDMQVGDSINFAIRLSKDGKMIGEAILWNFTADNYAELGCRIMPEYHGEGYGKAAFGAVADFAEKTLGVKVCARCFRENIPSYRMITASGFKPWRETETHQFFCRGKAAG